jgi:hypothetical protein
MRNLVCLFRRHRLGYETVQAFAMEVLVDLTRQPSGASDTDHSRTGKSARRQAECLPGTRCLAG